VGNSCYLKFPHPASRFAVCGCAVAADVSGGTWSSLRVAYNGISGATFRDQGIEQALEGQAISEDSIRAASDNAAAGAELMGDAFASEEYRRNLAQVFARRALTQLARG
jgi:carbon-monoxide dehydrogenase medium subunit